MEEKHVAKFQSNNAGTRPGGEGHTGRNIFNSHRKEPGVGQSKNQITGNRGKDKYSFNGVKIIPGQ